MGKKGTVIIENTRGYHKGTSVILGKRMLLQFEFSINPNCAPYLNNINITHLNDKLKNNINLYPYTYQLVKYN